ncbi:hypothetical protein BACCIP111895_04397 [Neobacillus rhizosphaerae]|uniref:Type I restriction modification DNA specificity domain-containing protein n=1 Tax=Neobacillus rhizosphaerae TaxID=2880965 RepID=A0ABN8KXK2_9BACI|nr:restriction endonuclease subunit S [Neobacillus rhizosphaerae]CAH2717207.1 hypothetical protein BACCIP111895_04397 [Neobacillus rhizosphaerae]
MSNAIVSLVSVCDFQGGTQPPKSEWITKYKDGYIQMLQIRDFTQERNENEYVPLKSNLKTCEEDDILIARYGASIGKILTGRKGAYNVAIIKTIPDEQKITKRYLYYYLKSNIFQNFVKNVGTRAAQAGFNKQDLENLEIYLPSLVRQKQIVEILESAHFLIDSRKSQIEALSSLKRSVFFEMFGNPTINPMKWDIKLLGEIVDNENSKRVPIKDADRKKISGIYPYYGATGIVDFINDYKLNGEYLLISEDGKALESRNKPIAFLVSGKFWVNNHAHIISDNGKCDLRYLETYIDNISIKNYVTGIDQYKLNRANLDKIPVMCPPRVLQEGFRNIVKHIEEQLCTLETSLIEFEKIYNSFLQRAFTGELFND